MDTGAVLVLALIAAILGTVWFVRFVWRLDSVTPRQAAEFEPRRLARDQKSGEAVLKAQAQLEAEGWKP